MQKEPFIIALDNSDLPNLSTNNNEDFGFEFNKTNLWQDNDVQQHRLLQSISDKMDVIIELLVKNGKE